MSRGNAKEGTRRHKGRASVLSRARALGIDGYLSPQESSTRNTPPEGSNGQAAGAAFLVPERLDTPMALNTRSRSTDSEMYLRYFHLPPPNPFLHTRPINRSPERTSREQVQHIQRRGGRPIEAEETESGTCTHHDREEVLKERRVRLEVRRGSLHEQEGDVLRNAQGLRQSVRAARGTCDAPRREHRRRPCRARFPALLFGPLSRAVRHRRRNASLQARRRGGTHTSCTRLRLRVVLFPHAV